MSGTALSCVCSNVEDASKLVKENPEEVLSIIRFIINKVCSQVLRKQGDLEGEFLDDLPQEIFLYLLETALPRYNGQYKMSTFICGVAQQQAFNALQKFNTRVVRKKDLLAFKANHETSYQDDYSKRIVWTSFNRKTCDSPLMEIIENEAKLEFEKTTKLSSLEKQMINLHFLERKNYRQISATLKCEYTKVYKFFKLIKNGDVVIYQ